MPRIPAVPGAFFSRLRYLLPALFLLWTVGLPAQTPLSDAKVEALVEALRQAAPPAAPDSGLYSDWRIKPDNIVRWSRRCLNQDVTPEQFAADPALARQVLVCVMGKVFREEFAAGGNNEIVAVQRAAAWWMAGDPAQYRDGPTSAYTLRVLEAYLRFF